MRPLPPTRRATRYILCAIALTALAVIIWRISAVVVVAFGGIVGAAVLRGLALPLARRTGWSEKWTITGVIFGLLALFILVGWLFGHQAADQFTEFQRLLPVALHDLRDKLQHSELGQALLRMIRQAPADAHALNNVGLAAGSLVGGLTDAMLVFFLAIYFAYTPHDYLEGVLRLLPPATRPPVRSALEKAGGALRQWLLAQLCAMAIIGILVTVALALLHTPLALLLGFVAALLEFVPVLGPVLFTIPGVLVAFTQSPDRALYVLVAYVVVQQIESNILIPLLQRWAVRLPPALTLLSVVIGGLLFGPVGVVFATPLAVVVQSLATTLYVEDTLENGHTPKVQAQA
ncbi:MAG TPA: AI-2E family transporter [Lacunisphaera sp.]|jgi:predicted PurR-regulated permease PerM|nr:AI-2E family transporter [Lacunisphaera sp.]